MTRRGAHAAIVAPVLLVLLGFAALALDAVYRIQARSEAQAVADLAARSAVIALRRTGDAVVAEQRADLVAAGNVVGGAAPTVSTFTVGVWDDRAAPPAFVGSAGVGNAVEVFVRREGLDAWFAQTVGGGVGSVEARSVAATRSMDLVVAVDLDPDWGEADFLTVRDGLLGLLDQLGGSAAPSDRVALVGYHSRFSWVLTPLTTIADAPTLAAIRTDWEALRPGSRAGDNLSETDGIDCVVHASPPLEDDFTAPAGGCYPALPRVYSDEDGTDIGLALDHAGDQWVTSPSATRAVVMVTRLGIGAIGAAAGTARAAEPYAEARFPERTSAAGQSSGDLALAASTAASTLHATYDAHVWVVTLGALVDVDGVAQGDGVAYQAADAADAASRVEGIATALPLGVVQ